MKLKTLDQIKAQAKAAGIAVDDYNYRLLGRDFVCIGVPDPLNTRPDTTPLVPASWATTSPKHGYVMLNMATGWFFGHTDKGESFSSEDQLNPNHQTDWYRALLTFFFTED